MNEIIRIWKECGVHEAEFHSDCGGDSMNETHWVFLDSKGETIDSSSLSVVESQLESDVYDNIQFYEASDGHYLGESGTVNVTLNDEGYGFDMDISRFIFAAIFFLISYILHRKLSFKEFKKVGVAIYADGVEDISLIFNKIQNISYLYFFFITFINI